MSGDGMSSEPEYVAIKKVSKKLWRQRISKKDADGLRYCVEDDILKQSLILHHLTVDNISSGDYIVKYIELFESKKDFYLVIQYVDDCMNLAKFIETAHEYIRENKLSFKEYRHIIKYILWQLTALLHWLHNDMHCCHGNLNLENILLKNAQFIANYDNQTYSINPSIQIKLCGFSKGELFDCTTSEQNPFLCAKHAMFTDHIQYLSPKLYDGQRYDARKADIWALGHILYECMVGAPLYTQRCVSILDDVFNVDKMDAIESNSGYWALEQDKLAPYMAMNQLSTNMNEKILSLLSGLLNVNEDKRLSAMEALKHQWFEPYYISYKNKIQIKSVMQRSKLKTQLAKMNKFPYYEL